MKRQNKDSQITEQNKSFSGIETRSFVVVVLILCAVLVFCGLLSYLIPQGQFERDADGAIIAGTFEKGKIEGIELWRVLTAPVRVFASEDAVTIIMISVFLLIMSGIFNLIEKTGGIKTVIGRILHRLRDKGGPVVCITVLIFMLFGSFFGMFEELVTLLPIIIVFMLSMNMDTMTGLGACLLAACFGFCAAITNPFSVGLAAEVAGVPASQGAWLRVVFFGIVFASVCIFLMAHLRKIERDPTASPTYEIDLAKRAALEKNAVEPENADKIFRVYASFFVLQGVVLLLIATVRSISSYAIVILAASFLIFGIISGLLVSERKRDVFRFFAKGAVSMLPAVFMIALASSAKLIMTESGIMDTIMNAVINALQAQGKYVAILLVFLLIFFLQFFIGSASAKIFLVMPIIMPVATALGISPSLIILAYCMADGFTDVILPTNPVLLIGLSMANVSYAKWVKWTWKLQLAMMGVSILTLFFGVAIGY